MKKVMVIGAGPAGISAAIYAKRGGMDVTVFSMGIGALEKAEKIDNYYGFPEGISGRELMEKGIKQAENLGIHIRNEEVVGLGFTDSLQIITTHGEYNSDAVILAMGSVRKTPKIENIENFEGRGVSYCAVCDGFFFKDKDVVVLGTGEYAKHEAEVLKPIARSVTMIPEAKSLFGEDTLEGIILTDESEIKASGLFVALGSAGSVDLAKKIGATTEGSSIKVNENMATNIPGLFAAGDCTGGLLQVAKAVYQGAEAGLSAIKSLR